MKKCVLSFATFLLGICLYCQHNSISVLYGRFWSPYRYIDNGSGFRNTPSSNYNFLPSVSFNRQISSRYSLELGLFFTLYKQYYGTRKYDLAFESSYGAGHLILNAAYSPVCQNKFEWRIKGGAGIGIAPNMYEGDYVESYVFPNLDSITRGSIKRNFTPIFPTINLGSDLTYYIKSDLGICLSLQYTKGFVKISQYDIYYNDGSGFNDQRAKQWGTGDFMGVQLGVRYKFKKRKKE
ncbi:MAG: hypothetical protein NTW29_10735 [Bacteroidetes bacterium]|nr:hypothetical protein [Bacteroidota bacterium]